MKKALAILFLGIFLFNTAGYFIVFNVEDYCAKQEIEQQIDHGYFMKELTKVTVQNNQLATIQWLEENKEMRFNGQMYDVVKSETNGTSITYYCIDDKKEASLFADLDDHINTHVAGKPLTNSKKLIDLVIKLYYPDTNNFTLTTFSTDHVYTSYFTVYSTTVIDKNTPPPELV